jgi:hypothetical protein
MAIFTARLDDRKVQSGQKPSHECREHHFVRSVAQTEHLDARQVHLHREDMLVSSTTLTSRYR